jgi:hypothetical protein
MIGCKDFFSSVFGDRKSILNLGTSRRNFVVGFLNHIVWDYKGYIPEVDIELYLTREGAEAGIEPFKTLAHRYENSLENSFTDDDDNIHYFFSWDSLDLVFEEDDNGLPYYESLFVDNNEKNVYIKVVDSDYPAIYDISSPITIKNEPHFRFFTYDMPKTIGEGSITSVKLIPHDQFGRRVKPSESEGVTLLDLEADLEYDKNLPQEGQIVTNYNKHKLQYTDDNNKNCYIPDNKDYVECNIEFGVDITSDTDLQIINDNKVNFIVTDYENSYENSNEKIWLDIKDFSIEIEPEINQFNLYTDITGSYKLWDDPDASFVIDEDTSFNIKVEAIDSYGYNTSNFDYTQWTIDSHPLLVLSNDFTLNSVTTDTVNAVFNLSLDNPGSAWMRFQHTDEEGNLHDYKSKKISVNDATPPSGSIEINDGEEYTNQTEVFVIITAYDYSSIEYRLSETPDGLNSETWVSYDPGNPRVSFTFDEPGNVGEINKTVYAQFKDDSDNETSTRISDSIIMDYGIVFVSKDHAGTGSNSGTRSNPVDDINSALALAYSDDFVKDTLTPEIWVAKTTSSYNEQLLLNQQVSLQGGYDYDGDVTWTRDEGNLENNLTSLSFDDTSSSSHGYTVKIKSTSTIEGFNIKGSGNQNDFSVIIVEGNHSPLITRNKIIGNTSYTPNYAYGIYNITNALSIINNNYEVKAGNAVNYSYGIYNNDSEPKIADNSLIQGSMSDDGSYGIYNVSSNIQIRDNTEIIGGETNESGSVSAGIYNDSSAGVIENNTTIKGASVQTNESYGIYNVSSSPMIYDNGIISGNLDTAPYTNQISYGIYINGKENEFPIIQNNYIFSGGTSTDAGDQAAGIFVTDLESLIGVSDRLRIENNLIECGDSHRAYGIGITSGSDYTMVRSNKIIVHGNTDTEKSAGTYVDDSYSCRFYNNAIYNNSSSDESSEPNVGMEFDKMNNSFLEKQFIAINNTILYINTQPNFIGILMRGNLNPSPDEEIDVINNIIQSYNQTGDTGIYIDINNPLKNSSQIKNNDFFDLNNVFQDTSNGLNLDANGLNNTTHYDAEGNIPDNPQFLNISGADGSITHIADNDLHPTNLSVYTGGCLLADLGSSYSDYPIDVDDTDGDGDTSELVDIEGVERTDSLSIGAYEYDD